MLQVRFWGVRGSIPVPGSKTIQTGGNTSCIEIFNDKNELLIIDAGTGIRNLGNHILKEYYKKGLRKCSILITHTHWDHIQGFPFFNPIYLNDFTINIYGPARRNDSIEDIIAGQMNYTYYPIKISDLKAKIQFIDIHEGDFRIDSYNIKAKLLNHPVTTFGYFVEYDGKSLATLYDHEIFRNVVQEDNGALIDKFKFTPEVLATSNNKIKKLNDKILQFLQRAQLIILDAQFTENEYYHGKQGWGHGPTEFIIKNSKAYDFKNVALFHHSPDKSDVELLEMKKNLEDFSKSMDSGLNLILAKENLVIKL